MIFREKIWVVSELINIYTVHANKCKTSHHSTPGHFLPPLLHLHPLRPLHLPHNIQILVNPLLRPNTAAQRDRAQLQKHLELRGQAAVDA